MIKTGMFIKEEYCFMTGSAYTNTARLFSNDCLRVKDTFIVSSQTFQVLKGLAGKKDKVSQVLFRSMFSRLHIMLIK